MRGSSMKRSTPWNESPAPTSGSAQRHERSVNAFFVLEAANRLTNGVIDLLFQSDEAGRSWTGTDVTLNQQAYGGSLQSYRAALRGLAATLSTQASSA